MPPATIASNPDILNVLRGAYIDAVRLTIILGLAGSCLAVPAALAMERLHNKRVAGNQRLAEKRSEGLGREEAKEIRVTAANH